MTAQLLKNFHLQNGASELLTRSVQIYFPAPVVPRHKRQQTNLGPSASLTLSSLFIVIVLTTQRARQRSRQQHRRQNFQTTLPYAIYSEERGVPATVLVRFCSEGDNTGEATDLALYLNRWKNLFPVAAGKIPPLDWPASWKHPFGNPFPASTY